MFYPPTPSRLLVRPAHLLPRPPLNLSRHVSDLVQMSGRCWPPWPQLLGAAQHCWLLPGHRKSGGSRWLFGKNFFRGRLHQSKQRNLGVIEDFRVKQKSRCRNHFTGKPKMKPATQFGHDWRFEDRQVHSPQSSIHIVSVKSQLIYLTSSRTLCYQVYLYFTLISV